jgi:hypothetical protein
VSGAMGGRGRQEHECAPLAAELAGRRCCARSVLMNPELVDRAALQTLAFGNDDTEASAVQHSGAEEPCVVRQVPQSSAAVGQSRSRLSLRPAAHPWLIARSGLGGRGRACAEGKCESGR